MLVIDKLETLIANGGLVLPPGRGSEFFAGCLESVEEPPELVVHVVTCEVPTLSDGDVAAWMRQALAHFPDARHCIVSLACLGFYAALMHVHKTGVRSAVVLVMDAPFTQTQSMLDALGMGSGDGADNMVSQEGVAFIHLLDKAAGQISPADLVIEEWSVVAKAQGMARSAEFMAKVGTVLRTGLPSGGNLVSFEIGSQWARKLFSWFEQDIQPRLQPLRILASSERDCMHRLSVKPLLEIERYRHILKQDRMLAICALGAGGRFGFLKLAMGRGAIASPARPIAKTVERPPVDFANNEIRVPHESGYLFAASEYRGIDNMYFHWPVHCVGNVAMLESD